MNSKHIQFLIALAIVIAMPLFMRSGSLASEVLIYALEGAAGQRHRWCRYGPRDPYRWLHGGYIKPRNNKAHPR